METAAAKKKRNVSMIRAFASVAPESCGIIFRVIHPPRRAPTAKQVSAMSDPETERSATAPPSSRLRGRTECLGGTRCPHDRGRSPLGLGLRTSQLVSASHGPPSQCPGLVEELI